MRWIVVFAFLLAGCLEAPADENAPLTDGDCPDCPAVPTQAMYMHDCQQAVLIFQVPLERLQSYLPPGYEAISSEQQFSQLSPLPVLPASAGRGWFFVEAHGCAMEDGGPVAIDVNQQIAILHGPNDADLPFATVLAYELDRAGTSAFSQFWQTLGGQTFVDEVTFRLDDEGLHRTASAHVLRDGKLHVQFDLPAVPENALELEDAYGRFWREHDNLTMWAGWDAGKQAGQPVNAYIGGPPPSCTFGAGTVAAELLGVTTCSEAMAAGIPMIPLMPEVHDMDTNWRVLS